MSAPAPAGRCYVGTRLQTRPPAVLFLDEGERRGHELPPRLDLRNHSPDGFEWGYGGSGPAQLALALLADATGDDALALRCYSRFKEEIVEVLQAESWSLSAEIVRDFALSLDAPRAPGELPNPDAGGASSDPMQPKKRRTLKCRFI